MNIYNQPLHDIFSKNRAEEFGYDVWNHFVIPRFFDSLDMTRARKPRLIIGGRGCGKTMLLRYLSHQTMFSKERKRIPDDAVSHLGLYWRADTQFCNAMQKRDKNDDLWHSAFNHFVAIILGMEVLGCLDSIADSNFRNFNESDIDNLDFSKLKAFGITLPTSARKLTNELEMLLWEFEGWVNDVHKRDEPVFLPGHKFILAMIQIIHEQSPVLKNAIFFVYLDEYENLCEYQQKIINTWLKHSEAPLIFNLAMKKNSFDTKKTVGKESLSDIHDFRQHDLENYLLKEDFQAFAAEILFLNLSLIEFSDLPIVVSDLRNPNKLPKRKDPLYVRKLDQAAQQILPDVSQIDLAKDVFNNISLASKLRDRIAKALKHRGTDLSVDHFFNAEFPEASIVTSALLHRKKLNPKEIADEFEKLKAGNDNRFTGKTNWIHNNFVGCLLQLYAPYSRACPFYGGFKTFCALSRGNLRHFLELCYKSISRDLTLELKDNFPIEPNKQAEAARQASVSFLGEVRSFGRMGNQLHTFVLRLGSLFEIAHRRYTQSESEQSHFSITSNDHDLTRTDHIFLKEATKWSVLFEHKGTKKKEHLQPEDVEYILNPIYAPYFHISYRKKRKLILSSSDVICLIRGDLSQYKAVAKRFSQLYDIQISAIQQSLFTFIKSEELNENTDAGE